MIIEKENTEDDNKSNLFINKSFEVEKMKGDKKISFKFRPNS